jgi:hypothetical protein
LPSIFDLRQTIIGWKPMAISGHERCAGFPTAGRRFARVGDEVMAARCAQAMAGLNQ